MRLQYTYPDGSCVKRENMDREELLELLEDSDLAYSLTDDWLYIVGPEISLNIEVLE